MPEALLEFCNYIECAALVLDQNTRVVEHCTACKAYQLFDFFKVRAITDPKIETIQLNNEKIKNHCYVLALYKKALHLACADIKDSKRFCPRFHKMGAFL
jgi:hypothetical protein